MNFDITGQVDRRVTQHFVNGEALDTRLVDRAMVLPKG